MQATHNRLEAIAIANAEEIITITREDGSSFRTTRGHGIATDGSYQVYVVPVAGRTKSLKAHYRATYYMLRDGKWERVNKAGFYHA